MWYLDPELLYNLKISILEDNYYLSSFNIKDRKFFPEEFIRQLLYIKLILHYGIPEKLLKIEYSIQMGVSKKRADIMILNKDLKPYIIAETKKTLNENTKEQLKSYINVTRASFGILASQEELLFFKSIEGDLIQIKNIPFFNLKDEDVVVDNTNSIKNLDMMGISDLKRISDKNSEITIQNKNFKITNSDFLKYEKIRKLAIEQGIVIPFTITREHWHYIVQNLFANATDLRSENVNSDSFPILNYIKASIERGYLYETNDFDNQWECEYGAPVTNNLIFEGYSQFTKNKLTTKSNNVSLKILSKYLAKIGLQQIFSKSAISVQFGRKVVIRHTTRAFKLGKLEEFKEFLTKKGILK